jgi:hypothetical protein
MAAEIVPSNFAAASEPPQVVDMGPLDNLPASQNRSG